MKLREYLEATKLKQEIFAKHVGITHRTLVNALLGKEVKLSTAIKIEKATCGAVTCHDMFLAEADSESNTKKDEQQNNDKDSLNNPVGTPDVA